MNCSRVPRPSSRDREVPCKRGETSATTNNIADNSDSNLLANLARIESHGAAGTLKVTGRGGSAISSRIIDGNGLAAAIR